MSRDPVDITANDLPHGESHSRNVIASITPTPNSGLAENTAQQNNRSASDLSITGAEPPTEMPPDNGSPGPSPIPSSIRAPIHLSNSQRRSTSFSTNGTSQQNGARGSILDLRARTLHVSAPASSSLEQQRKAPLDNMAQLQRMDLVKARTGSVLSRGFILKTDFYPSGEHLCSFQSNTNYIVTFGLYS